MAHPDVPTLEDVAKRVGVSIGMIGNVETGVATPSEETLRKWLRALQLPDEWADRWLEMRTIEEVDSLLAQRGVDAESRGTVRLIIRCSYQARALPTRALAS